MRCRMAVLAVLAAAGLFAVPVFQVQAIGPTGYASGATAISGTGVVVGNYVMPDGSSRGFLYQDGAVTTLALPAGASQTWANAVSDGGAVGGGGASAGDGAAGGEDHHVGEFLLLRGFLGGNGGRQYQQQRQGARCEGLDSGFHHFCFSLPGGDVRYVALG